MTDLLPHLIRGIKSAASRRSRGDLHLAEDLAQEGVLGALSAIHSNPELPQVQLIKLAGLAAKNRMRDAIRYRLRNQQHEDQYTKGNRAPGDTVVEVVIGREFEMLLRYSLGERTSSVLRLHLRGESGACISRLLGVSPATVSREISTIREHASELGIGG